MAQMTGDVNGKECTRQEMQAAGGCANGGKSRCRKSRWREVQMAGSANGRKCMLWQEVQMAGKSRQASAGEVGYAWVVKERRGRGGQSAYCNRLGVLKEGTYLVQFPVSSDIVPIPGSLIPFLSVGSEEIILYEADVESHAVSEGVEPLSPDVTLI